MSTNDNDHYTVRGVAALDKVLTDIEVHEREEYPSIEIDAKPGGTTITIQYNQYPQHTLSFTRETLAKALRHVEAIGITP